MTETAISALASTAEAFAKPSSPVTIVEPTAAPTIVVTPTPLPIRHVTALARRRWLRSPGFVSFLLLVVIPTMLMAGYILAFASQRYTSEFRVTVRSVEPLAQASGGLTALLGLGGMAQTSTDSNAVVQYLQSRQAVDDLDKTMSLQGLYGTSDIDWWSRLQPKATIEALARYWEKMIDCYFEGTTGTIVVKVTAFSPDAAETLARGALSLSETLVNGLSERSRKDTVAFAESNLSSAEARLTAVSAKLQALRDAEGILDPKKAAEATLTLAARLSAQISTAKADLETQRKYLSDTSPSVTQARLHLEALNNELLRINGQATADGGSSRPLSSVMGNFEQVENDRSFAEKAYQSALTALEGAKLEASRQQIYLATIIPPGRPEEPSFPRPFRNIATTFALALAAWVIAMFGFYAVREHV